MEKIKTANNFIYQYLIKIRKNYKKLEKKLKKMNVKNNYQIKPDFNTEPLVTAEKNIKYVKSAKKISDFSSSELFIMSYQRGFISFVRDNFDTEKISFMGANLYYFTYKNIRIGVAAEFGIGAPMAALVMEVLCTLGAKKIISVGSAGSLQKDIDIGEIVIIDKALREEGTSFHYLEGIKNNNQFAFPSQKLTKELIFNCEKLKIAHTVGAGWTTDAPYRETIGKVESYQKKGILTVDMEASALFAVGDYKKIEVASAFTISDSLSEEMWSPKFDSKKTQQGLEKLFNIAADSLLGIET
ncbi:MAG: nucleoside phosphorylase [Oligoflexia bacterium]|nr:nucleoside phosphorylase [Oligoflexia bacterium]